MDAFRKQLHKGCTQDFGPATVQVELMMLKHLTRDL